jgi:uncharacterized iron-regulated protein
MGKSLKHVILSRILGGAALGFILLTSSVACAQAQVWTSQGQLSDFEELKNSLKTHSVIIMGENHGLRTHQAQHLQVLQALRDDGRVVHVGLEFFPYTHQTDVDSYRLGQLSEPDFLKAIQWGNPPFDYYKAQAIFPDYSRGERTWALNAPQVLATAISKTGIAGLTPDLKALMPPGFGLGRDSYRERFMKVIGGHFSDPKLAQNYFEAQSNWDDTMAWRIQTFQEQNPNAVLVVIIGEYHVQYGGGLPDRLRARGVHDVLVISQVNTNEMTADEVQKEVQPDVEYGPRADWIWTAPAVN